MQYKVTKNDFYLLTGPATLNVIEGKIEAIAAQKKASQTLVVPLGKKIPVLAIENSLLEVEAPTDGFVKMQESSIPPQWDEVAQTIAKSQKDGTLYKILILGEVDTGKTFFSTYLANRLMQKIGKTAILDCDSGQSDIGCTGSFGMLVLDEPLIFLTEKEADHSYLIGAHSPGLHFLPTLTGLVEMLRIAEQEAKVLIVDTTGWVQGDGGRALKKAKLDIMQPDTVVLMQRTTELEHLVKHLPDEKIVRLPVSKKASFTSQMDRKALRERVSKKYFENAKVIEIPFEQVFTDRVYFLTGTKIELEGTLHAERLSAWEGTLVITSDTLLPEMTKSWPKDLGMIKNYIAGEEKGLMLSLLDESQNTLAVARLEEMDFLNNRFRIRSQYKGDLAKIKGIRFGSLKITENGEEAGFIEPGTF